MKHKLMGGGGGGASEEEEEEEEEAKQNLNKCDSPKLNACAGVLFRIYEAVLSRIWKPKLSVSLYNN